MKLEPGDVIQVDGGSAIVTETKGEKALIASLNISPGRSSHALKNGVPLEITRNRLLERGGAERLAAFFLERNEKHNNERQGKTKLEVGDSLCYQGAICVVLRTTSHTAVIGHPDGSDFVEDRWVNEFFLQCGCRKLERIAEESKRLENKAKFLERRSQLQPADKTDHNKNNTMPKNTKKSEATKKQPAKSEGQGKTTEPKSDKKVSCAGLSEHIAKMVESGGTEFDVVRSAEEKFPGVSVGYIQKITRSKLQKRESKS